MDKLKYCKLLITDDGHQLITMPDGTIIPAQIMTKVTQDVCQCSSGIGYAFIKVMVDLKNVFDETK